MEAMGHRLTNTLGTKKASEEIEKTFTTVASTPKDDQLVSCSTTSFVPAFSLLDDDVSVEEEDLSEALLDVSTSSSISNEWIPMRKRSSSECTDIFQFDEELSLASSSDKRPRRYLSESETDSEDDGSESEAYKPSSSVSFDKRSVPTFVNFLERILSIHDKLYPARMVGSPHVSKNIRLVAFNKIVHV